MEFWGRNQAAFETLYVLSLRPKMFAARDAVQACLKALDEALPATADIVVPDLITGGRVLSDNEARTLLPEWNALAGEDQARCHFPHHGLATVQNGSVDWFASICFQCANVYIDGRNATEGHRIIQFEGCEFEERLNGLLATG